MQMQTVRLPHPPGPTILSLMNNLFSIRRDPLSASMQLVRQYGDVVRISGGPIQVYLLSHPDDIYEVLVTHASHFRKGILVHRAKQLMGNGLLTSDTSSHEHQRKLLLPAFRHSQITEYASSVAEHVMRLSNRWTDGQSIDIARAMMDLTLGIVGDTLFGTQFDMELDALRRTLADATRLYMKYALIPYGELLLRLSLRDSKRLRAIQSHLDTLVARLVADHKKRRIDDKSFLSLLLQARDDNGMPLSAQQIRDEVVTFLIAGHETIGVALSWSWYLLDRHKDVAVKLRRELQATLYGRAPEARDLPDLSYVRMVLTEVMRLYPPLPALSRCAIVPHHVRDYLIPAGAQVIMCQYIVHRDPRWYPEPEVFRPERWSSGIADRPKRAYFPFGAGRRGCIAEAFAWLMGTLCLASLANQWDAEVQGNKHIEMEPLVTLQPKGGIPVRLRRLPRSEPNDRVE